MIENIFPTPIYYSFNDDETFEKIQKEITDYLNSVDYFQNEMRQSGVTKYVTAKNFNSSDIISEVNLSLLGSSIDFHLNEYCKELGFKKTSYKRSSWISMFNYQDSLVPHDHAYADISGIYYYSGSEDSGKIGFGSPLSVAKSSLCYQKHSMPWYHSPMPGKFLLFPGWLVHGIEVNLTKVTRISIPFNIFFSRNCL